MEFAINKNLLKDFKEYEIIEALGVLPHWVFDYNMMDKAGDIVDFMEQMYGFGPLYKFKGQVDHAGVYHHEGDEPLEWMAKARIADGVVYFYPYAMVGLPTPDGYFVTRMD